VWQALADNSSKGLGSKDLQASKEKFKLHQQWQTDVLIFSKGHQQLLKLLLN